MYYTAPFTEKKNEAHNCPKLIESFRPGFMTATLRRGMGGLPRNGHRGLTRGRILLLTLLHTVSRVLEPCQLTMNFLENQGLDITGLHSTSPSFVYKPKKRIP